jgi:putative transposase
MNTYKRHRFPPDIISYAVWLYYRFNLSHADIEDLLAERETKTLITITGLALREIGRDFRDLITSIWKRGSILYD